MCMVENGMLFFLAEFDHQAKAICPRGLLNRVVEKAEDYGLLCTLGV